MKYKKINLPMDEETSTRLRAGEPVLLSGVIYTARDAAHKEICRLISKRKPVPIELKNAIIYYAGPAPAAPGTVTSSAGPTTSSRMDGFVPALLKLGLKGMIGKGSRSTETVEAMKKYGAVYFAATGGAGAYLAGKIKSCRPVAFRELGTEAVYRLEVEDFPVIVINDVRGNDFYEKTRKRLGIC